MIPPASAGDDTTASSAPRSALLVGATGLVGGHCLELLDADPFYIRVSILVRRPLTHAHSPKVEQHVVDFDHLDALPDAVRAAHVFCALGTTIRQAGSPGNFRRVDFGYPLAVAKWALSRGAEHFAVVSSLGADPNARVLYTRVKGEMEAELRTLTYHGVTIVRPSLLLGDREEFRLGEELARRFGFLMPARYKPIDARRVAAAMISSAKANRPGTRLIESAELQLTGAGT